MWWRLCSKKFSWTLKALTHRSDNFCIFKCFRLLAIGYWLHELIVDVLCFSICGLNLLLPKALLINHGSWGGRMQEKLHIELVCAVIWPGFFCSVGSFGPFNVVLYRISPVVVCKLCVEASSAWFSGVRPMAHCCTGWLTKVSTKMLAISIVG